METAEEEILAAEAEEEDEEILMEAWPIIPEDYTNFEDYLADIGVRF